VNKTADGAAAWAGELDPAAVQQILERRADDLARVPVAEEAGERLDLVLLRLGNEAYGVETQYVFEIRTPEEITRVPRVPDCVAGVTAVRGRILSVLNLRRYLGLGPGPGQEGNARTGPRLKGVLVVVAAAPGRSELALWVDEVLAVRALPANRIQEAADTLRGLPPEMVRGVCDRPEPAAPPGGDGLLVVLNLPALLADRRLVVEEELG